MYKIKIILSYLRNYEKINPGDKKYEFKLKLYKIVYSLIYSHINYIVGLNRNYLT